VFRFAIGVHYELQCITMYNKKDTYIHIYIGTFTPHLTLYTLYHTLYTLYHTLYTLYYTLYTHLLGGKKIKCF